MEKKPFVTKEQIEEIAKTYPTPFHIYDEKGIRENARRLKQAFSWNPGFREYFAVKATPNPFILKSTAGGGLRRGLLLPDRADDERCLRSSTARDIMFSSNVTPAEDFQPGQRSWDAYINLDDFTHIEFLEKVAGLPETICCRYNPGGNFQIANKIMDNPGDAKYGFTKEQIIEGYKILMAKGVKHFGLHAFLASNTTTNEYYPKLARILFELAVELKEKTGADIRFVNLSGGVGVAYRPEEDSQRYYGHWRGRAQSL